MDFDLLTAKMNDSWEILLLALIMMPVNWILETIKWRGLVNQIQEISIIKSLKSILAGILLSLITPNRVGELGGKLIYIEKEKRSAVLYINSVCAMTQLLVTMLAGLFSLFFLQEALSIWIKVEGLLLLGLIVLTSLLLLIVFFRSNTLMKVFNIFSKKQDLAIKLDTLSRVKLIGISLVRYFVFCIQFYIIIRVFEAEISFFESSVAIALIFLLTAVVPTGWISDLPVRTSIAFFVFELMSFNGSSGLSASILLWLINLLIPALISLVLLRNIDWMGKLNWKLS